MSTRVSSPLSKCLGKCCPPGLCLGGTPAPNRGVGIMLQGGGRRRRPGATRQLHPCAASFPFFLHHQPPPGPTFPRAPSAHTGSPVPPHPSMPPQSPPRTFVRHLTLGASCGYVGGTLNVNRKVPPLHRGASRARPASAGRDLGACSRSRYTSPALTHVGAGDAC